MTASGPPVGAQVTRRVLALTLTAYSLFLLYDYPVFRPLLGGLLLLYGGLMFRWPLLWLAVLPACVPLLQLAHWSGRLFLEDLDIVFVFTLAALLWRMPSASPHPRLRLPLTLRSVVLALALSYLASLMIGLFPWPDWRAPDFLANFLSPANALRLAKGFFWAMLFSPFIFQAFREHPAKAQKMVIGGMVAGGLVIGVMAMWERGVWHALIYGRDRYQLLSPLLDFSTPYRITGTFAEMHTGGEAIDGYLGLAWPMMVLALALSRKPWALALSSVGLGLVIYSLVTTFSRGLYFSLALAGAVWVLGLVRIFRGTPRNEKTLRIGPLLVLLGLEALLMGFGFSRGGMPGLASTLLMFCAAAWLAWRPIPTRGANSLFLLVTFGLCVWAATRGMFTSKWHPIGLSMAAPLAFLLTSGAGVLGHMAGRSLPRGAGLKPYLVIVMMLVIGAGTLAPALLGYRMTARLSDVGADFSMRSEHWRHALSLKQGHLLDQVLGMGLGSFPREYHWDIAHRTDASGDFSIVREQGSAFLRTTGGKDLRLGQRLSVGAMEPMQLRMRVRTPSPEAWLRVRLCRRFVIHPSEWNSECVTLHRTLNDTRGQWRDIRFDFDTGHVGDGLQRARAPLLLEVNNRREYGLMSKPPARIDIDNISLTDRYGKEYVANGDFEHGVDRWVPYYDFNHLPWHIKNLWLHLYFEQGALGVAAFAASWLVALVIGWRASRRGEIFPLGVAAALTGFVAVGTFGSPIDAPRVAWLYYFLWFVLVAHSAQANSAPAQAGRRRNTVILEQTG